MLHGNLYTTGRPKMLQGKLIHLGGPKFYMANFIQLGGPKSLHGERYTNDCKYPTGKPLIEYLHFH
jgi:hypothetical protein